MIQSLLCVNNSICSNLTLALKTYHAETVIIFEEINTESGNTLILYYLSQNDVEENHSPNSLPSKETCNKILLIDLTDSGINTSTVIIGHYK